MDLNAPKVTDRLAAVEQIILQINEQLKMLSTISVQRAKDTSANIAVIAASLDSIDTSSTTATDSSSTDPASATSTDSVDSQVTDALILAIQDIASGIKDLQARFQLLELIVQSIADRI